MWLRELWVDGAMAGAQDTGRADVLEYVDPLDLVIAGELKFFQRNINIAKDLAILVRFADDDEDVHIVVILAGHEENRFGRPNQGTSFTKCVRELNVVLLVVGLIGWSI